VAFHEELRNHRLKKGLILEEISEETKINVRILQALEQGNFHILPIPYVRLFMKAYAQAIDYPVEDIIRGLENELQLTGDQMASPMSNIPADLTPDKPHGDLDEKMTSSIMPTKSSQNAIFRLIGGLAVLILVIIVGKNLLRPTEAETVESPATLIPDINYAQPLDSLKLEAVIDSSHVGVLDISASGFLTIVVESEETGIDTQFLQLSETRSYALAESLRIALYPSENATLALESDTLPMSPFNNSWLVITVFKDQTELYTFPSY